MNFSRVTRHLLSTQRAVSRAFPPRCLHAIESAIKSSETEHTGEIRFVVEGALDGAPLYASQSARERALDVFSQFRIWDTEHNNGVLIYLLLVDRDVEIVADRGIHARVDQQEWETICRSMEASFKAGDFAGGVANGIHAVTRHLAQHFPASGTNPNELPNSPVIL
ncbi:MAG: TPM domain-containing protein [Betaproteobacteria bacterium]